MKKFFIIISLLFFYSCETPLNDIVVFSGYWRIICSDPSNNRLPEFTIVITDDGTFSNKVKIYTNVDTVFLKGAIDNNGTISAQFGDSLGVNKSGSFTGTFYELNGAKYGSGTWKDTLRGANSYGTWLAKSN
jgi:hypothetical protein